MRKDTFRIPSGRTVRYVITGRVHKRPLHRYVLEAFLHEVTDWVATSFERLLWDVDDDVTAVALANRLATPRILTLPEPRT